MTQGKSSRVCSIEGCEREVSHRGWCRRHYERWRRLGDPLGGGKYHTRTRTREEYFWTHVDTERGTAPIQNPTMGACWVWTGSLDDDGYGRWNQRGSAHRVSYELFVGAIPDGMTIDHLCHDPIVCAPGRDCPHRRCVNPAHLVPATMRDNVLRGGGFSAVNATKTHCDHGHEFTVENTYWHPRGVRKCRACMRESGERYKARQRAMKEPIRGPGWSTMPAPFIGVADWY